MRHPCQSSGSRRSQPGSLGALDGAEGDPRRRVPGRGSGGGEEKERTYDRCFMFVVFFKCFLGTRVIVLLDMCVWLLMYVDVFGLGGGF